MGAGPTCLPWKICAATLIWLGVGLGAICKPGKEELLGADDPATGGAAEGALLALIVELGAGLAAARKGAAKSTAALVEWSGVPRCAGDAVRPPAMSRAAAVEWFGSRGRVRPPADPSDGIDRFRGGAVCPRRDPLDGGADGERLLCATVAFAPRIGG